MTLRKWFDDLPIQSKLTLINVVVVLAAMTPLVGITLSYEYYSVRRSILSEAEVQANIIRDNVSAATAFADGKAASEILEALRSSPNVMQAVVLLPDNVVLARYVAPESTPRRIDKSSGTDTTSIDDSYIRVSRVIHLKQDPVGWVAIETSTEPLQDRLNLYLMVILLAAISGAGIAYPLARKLKESITGPLADLMALARHVTLHEDYSPPGKTNDSKDEIGDLSKAFNSMLSSIRQHDQRLNQMAYDDSLTGLANRRNFMARLDQAVATTRRYGTRCCVMFVDLDEFKAINDTYGHHIGDELLREVARQLRATSRDTDFVCRLGGDEFAILIEDVADLAGPEALAGKIIAALSEPMHVLGAQLKIGASIGIAACPDHAAEMADLLRAADTAMYWAKEHGRNCYRVYPPSEGRRASR